MIIITNEKNENNHKRLHILMGLKEKKKAKVGCKWQSSFPKTQPCFYFLKFQLPLGYTN